MSRLARGYVGDRASGTALLRSDPTAVHVFCTEFELTEPPLDVELPPDVTAVRVLVRVHRIPLGFVTVAPEAFAQPEVVSSSAFQEFGDQIRDHLGGAGAVPETGDSLLAAGRRPRQRPMLGNHVTVVVATRNRPSHLRECLRTLLSLDYANFDVVVVDNAPDTDETERVFELVAGIDERFRYVKLDQAGVSRARNAGLAAARGPLVAFVDDDVRVDPFWLQALAWAFNEQPAVVCVTGLVAAQSIVGAEQLYFDSRVRGPRTSSRVSTTRRATTHCIPGRPVASGRGQTWHSGSTPYGRWAGSTRTLAPGLRLRAVRISTCSCVPCALVVT